MRGWKGLLIEPRQKFAGKIKKFRPKDIHEQVALMDYDGEIEMYQNAPNGSAFANQLKERGYKNPYIAKCVTMNTLLEKYPDFKEPDFISLDIATGEEKMLKGCDFEIFKSKVMCIEYCVSDNSGERIDYRPKWEHFFIKYYELKHLHPPDAYYLRKRENK